MGHREDIQEHPELLYGTVDMEVPSDYYFPNPPSSSVTELNALPTASQRKPETAVPQQAPSSSASNPWSNALPESLRPDFGKAPTGLLANLTLGEPSVKELRQPSALNYVFALDVSWNAGKCGLVREWCEGLRAVLFGEEGVRLPVGCRVAFVTFDETVHFYEFSVSCLSLPSPFFFVWVLFVLTRLG